MKFSIYCIQYSISLLLVLTQIKEKWLVACTLFIKQLLEIFHKVNLPIWVIQILNGGQTWSLIGDAARYYCIVALCADHKKCTHYMNGKYHLEYGQRTKCDNEILQEKKHQYLCQIPLQVSFSFIGLSDYVQGRILSIAGVTVAICAAPFVAFLNMIAIAIWPTWVAVAASETVRKVFHEFLICFLFLLSVMYTWSICYLSVDSVCIIYKCNFHQI